MSVRLPQQRHEVSEAEAVGPCRLQRPGSCPAPDEHHPPSEGWAGPDAANASEHQAKTFCGSALPTAPEIHPVSANPAAPYHVAHGAVADGMPCGRFRSHGRHPRHWRVADHLPPDVRRTANYPGESAPEHPRVERVLERVFTAGLCPGLHLAVAWRFRTVRPFSQQPRPARPSCSSARDRCRCPRLPYQPPEGVDKMETVKLIALGDST